jgi:hypothetical protein
MKKINVHRQGYKREFTEGGANLAILGALLASRLDIYLAGWFRLDMVPRACDTQDRKETF